jgi:hypothetical protein
MTIKLVSGNISTVADPVLSENLCFLQYAGFHLQNKDVYKDLVNNPSSVCERCGRTARSKQNLCDPTPLD